MRAPPRWHAATALVNGGASLLAPTDENRESHARAECA